jgi:hypothetical protein
MGCVFLELLAVLSNQRKSSRIFNFSNEILIENPRMFRSQHSYPLSPPAGFTQPRDGTTIFPQNDLVESILNIVGDLSEDDLSFVRKSFIKDAIKELDGRCGRINQLKSESWIPEKFRTMLIRMLEFNPYFRLSPY